MGFGSGFRVLRGDGGTEGGGGRICIRHKSVFEMMSFFLCFPVIGSLHLGVGGGSVQLEYSFFLSGSTRTRLRSEERRPSNLY